MEKTWIKNDEMNRKRRELLMNSLWNEINLICNIIKNLLSKRQIYMESILFFERQILSMNSIELRERERNISYILPSESSYESNSWYINEAKEVIRLKENKLFELKNINNIMEIKMSKEREIDQLDLQIVKTLKVNEKRYESKTLLSQSHTDR